MNTSDKLLRINALCTVCSIQDLKTWQTTSLFLLKYLECDSYTLIVPKEDISTFIKKTPSEFTVLPEEDFVGDLGMQLRIRHKGLNIRTGWYLQQFIKLSFLYRERFSEGSSLIWDADTAPLKKINFFDNGKVFFYSSSEYHEPYFETIYMLLQLRKEIIPSFVAQCMACPNLWTLDFFNHLENSYEKDWIEIISESVNFKEESSFSEYETLGTYFYSKFSKQMLFKSSTNWQRHGNGLIGRPYNLKFISWLLSAKYDFIAFEKWDKSFSFYRPFIQNKIRNIFYG
jgi:hypothetical protein